MGLCLVLRADPAVFLGKRRCLAAETDSQLAAGKCELLEKFDQTFSLFSLFYLNRKNPPDRADFYLYSA